MQTVTSTNLPKSRLNCQSKNQRHLLVMLKAQTNKKNLSKTMKQFAGIKKWSKYWLLPKNSIVMTKQIPKNSSA